MEPRRRKRNMACPLRCACPRCFLPLIVDSTQRTGRIGLRCLVCLDGPGGRLGVRRSGRQVGLLCEPTRFRCVRLISALLRVSPDRCPRHTRFPPTAFANQTGGRGNAGDAARHRRLRQAEGEAVTIKGWQCSVTIGAIHEVTRDAVEAMKTALVTCHVLDDARPISP